ncbi:MAG TPA: biopolymer transporter ExbD, partial [Gemmataceae bacterium]|nr:biopolymer transporter ExbD [Gemmataceae bacterium]
GYMDFNLPAAGEAKAKKEEDVDPNTKPDSDLEIESELTVIVKTARDENQGAITSITVQAREDTVPIENLQKLGEYLREARKKLSNRDDIKIQAESKLKYEFVVKVMDICIKSGFQRVGFAPPPDLATTGG